MICMLYSMVMQKEIADAMACPRCRGIVRFDAEKILCPACGLLFPIVEGVPMMVPDATEDKSSLTAERFGYEWQKFAENYNEYEDQFLDWIAPVTPDFFKDKVVLDAGCGKGKHSVIAESFGARAIAAIDYGLGSIESARRYIRQYAKHPEKIQLIRADIRRLPFKPETFDYVYSIGVLHHLPDPKEGFLKLASLVKPGGSMSVWVYGYEGNALVRYTVEPLRRYVTSRIPQGLLLSIAWFITVPAFVVAKFVYRPINALAPKLYVKLPMAAYIRMWFDFPFKEIWNIIYDQLVTPITHYISREDIEDWLQTAGITKHEVSQRMGFSWRIFLTK